MYAKLILDGSSELIKYSLEILDEFQQIYRKNTGAIWINSRGSARLHRLRHVAGICCSDMLQHKLRRLVLGTCSGDVWQGQNHDQNHMS